MRKRSRKAAEMRKDRHSGRKVTSSNLKIWPESGEFFIPSQTELHFIYVCQFEIQRVCGIQFRRVCGA